MKLLAITGYYKPAYVYGGPVRSEASLYESLAKLGVEVTVITTDANGVERLDVPLLMPVDINGVQVIYCPTKPVPGSAFYSPTQITEAKRFIPDADIVNIQTFWGYATRTLGQYCVKYKTPYFVSLRGQLMDYAMKQTSWIKRLKKRLFLHWIGYQFLNGAAALHVTTSLEITHLRAYPINTPTFLIPNGIEVDTFKSLPMRGTIRTLYAIPDDALVMVMIGRLHLVKNPHIAVATLIAAQKLLAEVYLIMVGPDEHNLKSSLLEQADAAGCAEKLHFTGLVQKDILLQVMADSDLLIMPSKSENFGMGAAESMAAGLPVLVSEEVPVGKWVESAGAGWMIPCTSEDFQQAACQLLDSPVQLREMGRRGQSLVADKFESSSVAQQMLAQFQAIIKTGKPLRNTIL